MPNVKKCVIYPIVLVNNGIVFVMLNNNNENKFVLKKIFFSECEDRFYNSNCSAECGKCLNDEICNKMNGHCVKGCQPYFKFPLCQGCSVRIYLLY